MKERIIGAVVLVVFVVLVVPIFLDGPPSDGELVTERVLLPGQEDQNIKTVVLERDRSVPIPAPDRDQEAAAASETAAPPEETPPPVVEQTAPAAVDNKPQQQDPEQSPEPQVTAGEVASTTGMWAVQLGSFSNRQNAEKLAADLRKQGYAAFLSKLATGRAELHRVRIGPQENRESAESTAAKLLKAGHKGQVVPHP